MNEEIIYYRCRIEGNNCKRLQITLGKKDIYCKNCGNPLHIVPMEQISGGKFSWRNRNEKVVTDKDDLIRELEKLNADYDALRIKFNSLNNEYVTLQTKQSESAKIYDEVCGKVAELTKELDKLRKELAEAEQIKADNQELNEFCLKLKTNNKQLREENASLESTATFLKADNERSHTLRMRDIVDMFLEYMTGIYNASLDIDDAEALGQMIRARTDKVAMTAEGLGLRICRSERGNMLGDGRVDIDIRKTEEQGLDGKVVRSRKFGCTFRNDVEPEIPERVSVWTYTPPKTGNIIVKPTEDPEESNTQTGEQVQTATVLTETETADAPIRQEGSVTEKDTTPVQMVSEEPGASAMPANIEQGSEEPAIGTAVTACETKTPEAASPTEATGNPIQKQAETGQETAA